MYLESKGFKSRSQLLYIFCKGLTARKSALTCLGLCSKCVRVGDFDSPFPKAGQAWADLCPALACWVCKLYDGLLLAVSSAKPIDVPWIYPVTPPAATCTKPLFCTSASPLYTEIGLVQCILRREIFHSCVLPGEKTRSLNIKADLLHEKKCRVHFVTMFLLLSYPEGKYFITAAVAKSTAVSQPSPRRGQHVTWLWAQMLRGMRAFFNHISPVLIQPRFSAVIYRLVYDLLWHCFGFTPGFSRQELTCFTIFLFSTTRSEKALKVDSQIAAA